MTDSTDRLAYTAHEVADLLGVSFSTIRRATADGVLPYRRLGRLVRYTRADIDAYLDSHRECGYV
jgi:excisionase family DNA binding protein